MITDRRGNRLDLAARAAADYCPTWGFTRHTPACVPLAGDPVPGGL